MCFLDELVLSQKQPPLIDMLEYLKRKNSMILKAATSSVCINIFKRFIKCQKPLEMHFMMNRL